MNRPKVYIILLNYNRWTDTIECLESVLRNNYPNHQVVVVDNNSLDNSMEYLKAWAEGKLDVWVNPKNPLRSLSFPPIPKPIPYVYYTKEEAEKGKNLKLEKNVKNQIVLIQSSYNGGFSYGNNIGIKYALSKNDFEYVWLLNNDTVIEESSLLKLVEKAQNYKRLGKKIGIIGSKIFYYDNSELLNGIGGKYNKWFGVSSHIGAFEKDLGQYDNEDIIKKIDYIMGASMFVSKDFIKDVGLMNEDYFLYYEEVDWCIRGKRKGYNLGYCWNSRVYHKEGKTISSTFKGSKRSKTPDYYHIRNRIIFTKKFYRKYLPFVYVGLLITLFNRIKRLQFKRIKFILEAITKA